MSASAKAAVMEDALAKRIIGSFAIPRMITIVSKGVIALLK